MSACPPVSCCCIGEVFIKPGEITNISVDWSAWLSGQPGNTVYQVTGIQILNLSLPNTPQASPSLIDLVPTLATPPTPPETWFRISKSVTEFTLEVDAATPINSMFRMNFTAVARNCDARNIQRTECLLIRVVDCY